MKAAPQALRGGPFASIGHSAFFLGSTAQMSCAESNAFFVSCKQQMAEMLPGRMPAEQAFPAGAAWMKPWDGAGHQVLSPPKSRVRSFTQRYLR